MRRLTPRTLLLPLPLLLPFMILIAACTDDAPPVSTDGRTIMADAHYYPTIQGCSWEYSIDTTGAGGSGSGIVRSRITGVYEADTVTYAVQINQITFGEAAEVDSLYVRHAADGVRISSPGLQTLSNLPPIPNFPIDDIPTEFLAVPTGGSFQGSWEIINIEINTIPLFPIYYRVTGSFRGITDVGTGLRTFRDCAHIVLSIDARLPDFSNPGSPLLIDEEASFWFSRPQGLVAADGSNAIFTLLRGGIPLSSTYGTTRQEVTAMDIVQPDPFCIK